MTLSLILACLWALAACVMALIPSRDNHWRRAYVLIAIGLPLLGFVYYQNGPLIAALVLLGGLSILRWPLIYCARWLRRRLAR